MLRKKTAGLAGTDRIEQTRRDHVQALGRKPASDIKLFTLRPAVIRKRARRIGFGRARFR